MGGEVTGGQRRDKYYRKWTPRKLAAVSLHKKFRLSLGSMLGKEACQTANGCSTGFQLQFTKQAQCYGTIV